MPAAKVITWFMVKAALTLRKCQGHGTRRHSGEGCMREKIEKEEEKKQKNKLSETPKNREEGGRVVPWELREASAMLLSAWKSTVSDFFPFCFFPFQKSTWKLFWGIEQVGVYGEADWGQEWAGLVKAAPSFSIRRTEVEDSEVQRPSGPELQPSVSEEPSAGQRWKLEAWGWVSRMKANHKSCQKKYPHLEKGEQHWYIFQEIVPWHLDFFFFFLPKQQNIWHWRSSSFTLLKTTNCIHFRC